ncbi:MAG TPA: 6-carboxytetrahydropterin synthase [Bacteroidia bacterium]|jgi:6-pyruvoyltetrahydropterin/6-carboxytetrahydropterin synthase|nr:6-carboxytetrahydropterin synthase [Bacteroidia bacterium]
MIYITRKEHFNAAHKLFNPGWTDEKNMEVFGKCANPNWHGHNYYLYVTVKGEVNPDTGYTVNLKELSTLIRMEVTDKLDHKNLNLDVDFMKNRMPTTENVAIAIWEQIADQVKHMGGELHCVKLYETDNNYVEYFGGK